MGSGLPASEGVIKPLMDQWLLDREAEEGPKPTATGSLLRMSQAGMCARQIAFQAVGVPEDFELEAGVLFTFDVGRHWHERIQQLAQEHLGAETEVKCTLEPEFPVSGSADFVYGDYVGEIKTVAGYAYGLATGRIWQESGPGPKEEHLLQAGMYAKALDKPNIHIVYIDKDKQGMAEWFYGPEDIWLSELVDSELERMKGIANRIAEGVWPRRAIPNYGTVEHPPQYMAKNGEPWNCRYCRWRDTCSQMPAAPTKMSEVAGIIERVKELDRADQDS